MAVRFRQFLSFPIIFATAGGGWGYVRCGGGIEGVVGGILAGAVFTPIGLLNALMLNTANAISYNSTMGYIFGLLGATAAGTWTYKSTRDYKNEMVVYSQDDRSDFPSIAADITIACVVASLGYSFSKMIGSSFGSILNI